MTSTMAPHAATVGEGGAAACGPATDDTGGGGGKGLGREREDGARRDDRRPARRHEVRVARLPLVRGPRVVRAVRGPGRARAHLARHARGRGALRAPLVHARAAPAAPQALPRHAHQQPLAHVAVRHLRERPRLQVVLDHVRLFLLVLIFVLILFPLIFRSWQRLESGTVHAQRVKKLWGCARVLLLLLVHGFLLLLFTVSHSSFLPCVCDSRKGGKNPLKGGSERWCRWGLQTRRNHHR